MATLTHDRALAALGDTFKHIPSGDALDLVTLIVRRVHIGPDGYEIVELGERRFRRVNNSAYPGRIGARPKGKTAGEAFEAMADGSTLDLTDEGFFDLLRDALAEIGADGNECRMYSVALNVSLARRKGAVARPEDVA
jgi:hypothetical protein